MKIIVSDTTALIVLAKTNHFELLTSFIDPWHKAIKQGDSLSNIAKHVILYKVMVPWNLKRLDEVYSAIVQHVKA